MKLEEKLKIAIKKGKEIDFVNVCEKIYNEYYKMMYFIAYQYTNNKMDSEDLVQETFLNFFNIVANKMEIRNIKYYLVNSIKNNAVQLLRKKKFDLVEIAELDKISLKESNYLNKEDSFINEINDILSPEEIAIITEYVLLGRGLKDVSKEKNIPYNTLKSKYRRAILKLRKHFGE